MKKIMKWVKLTLAIVIGLTGLFFEPHLHAVDLPQVAEQMEAIFVHRKVLDSHWNRHFKTSRLAEYTFTYSIRV